MLHLLFRRFRVVVQAAQTIAATAFTRSACIPLGALVSLCSQEFLSALISINKHNICTSKKNTHLKKDYCMWPAERSVHARSVWRCGFPRCVAFSPGAGPAESHVPINTPSCCRPVSLMRWGNDQVLEFSSMHRVWSLPYPYVHMQLIDCMQVKWFTGA